MMHTGYIVAAYAFTALVVVALIVWSVAQYRAQRHTLDALENKRT
jgi:heme exporter protein CcmD